MFPFFKFSAVPTNAPYHQPTPPSNPSPPANTSTPNAARQANSLRIEPPSHATSAYGRQTNELRGRGGVGGFGVKTETMTPPPSVINSVSPPYSNRQGIGSVGTGMGPKWKNNYWDRQGVHDDLSGGGDGGGDGAMVGSTPVQYHRHLLSDVCKASLDGTRQLESL